MKRMVSLMIAVCLLGLSACGVTGTSGQAATKAEDVAGIWRRTQPWTMAFGPQRWYVQLNLDGTMAMSPVPDKWDQPIASYEFGFEGSQFSLEQTHGRQFGGERASCLDLEYPTAVYEVQLLSNGNLKFVQAQDPCPDRRGILADAEWAPV
jgi:hypothetical protein